MNLFQEWIDTAKQIRDGVANHLSESNPEIEAMIQERIKHCVGDPENGLATCENFTHGDLAAAADSAFDFIRKLKGLPENELKDFNGKKCAQCGCGFQLYLKSPEKKCPVGKW